MRSRPKHRQLKRPHPRRQHPRQLLLARPLQRQRSRRRPPRRNRRRSRHRRLRQVRSHQRRPHPRPSQLRHPGRRQHLSQLDRDQAITLSLPVPACAPLVRGPVTIPTPAARAPGCAHQFRVFRVPIPVPCHPGRKHGPRARVLRPTGVTVPGQAHRPDVRRLVIDGKEHLDPAAASAADLADRLAVQADSQAVAPGVAVDLVAAARQVAHSAVAEVAQAASLEDVSQSELSVKSSTTWQRQRLVASMCPWVTAAQSPCLAVRR